MDVAWWKDTMQKKHLLVEDIQNRIYWLENHLQPRFLETSETKWFMQKSIKQGQIQKKETIENTSLSNMYRSYY